ncbi:MAG: InlB B-repeat-containing protein [Coprobacillaceae bacterium]
MKEKIKKSIFSLCMLCMLFSISLSQVSAGLGGGGASGIVVKTKYNFEVKYVDVDGNEIDDTLNVSDHIKGAGDFELEIKEIDNHTFQGFYYHDSLNKNCVGTLEELIVMDPPKASTLASTDAQDIETTSKEANYTVYMVYTNNTKALTYSVTYNANGGVGTITDTSNPYVNNTEATVLSDEGISREKYTFVEWNTEADGSGTVYKVSDKITMTENVTLYAQWKASDTKKPDEGSTGLDEVVVSSKTSTATDDNTVKTGDTTDAGMMLGLMSTALFGLLFAMNKKVKE